MFCKNCGKELPDGAAFCTSCGAPTSQTAEPGNQPPTTPINQSPVMPYPQPTPVQEKKRFSGFTIAADIIALLMPALMWIIRLLAQQSEYGYHPGSWYPSTRTYVPDNVKAIMFILLFVLMMLGLYFVISDKAKKVRSKVVSVIVLILMCLISLGAILLEG